MIPREVRKSVCSFYNNRSIWAILTFLESRDTGGNIVYNQALMESTGTWQTRRMRDADDSLFSLNLAASSSPAGGQASSGPSPPTTSDRPWPAPLHLVHQQLVLNELRHGDVASKELLLDSHGPPLPVQEGCLKYNYIYWAIFGRGGGAELPSAQCWGLFCLAFGFIN